jgi:ATP/maltotriose-dependent transcriptional regulator MalT
MAGPARSRLLSSLEAAIKAAANPIEALCLRAERAALLARQGQLERAQGVIDELQSQLAWQPNNHALRAWLALAEGLHGYYSVIGRDAQPTIELAYTLAQGSGQPRLRATAAAWLANMAFANDEMPRMAALVREALETAAPEHHGARARAALVAGYAYHYAGQAERAQRWYEASRRHAIAEGDEAHLSALMHNQAWMRASQARLALLFDANDGISDGSAVTHALMGAESIGHYDAGIGTASLGSLVPMLRAQVLTAQGRWGEALALFESHFDSALAEGLKRIAACLLADRAWCELQLGHADKARTLAGAAEQALAEPIDDDDRAIALARLALVRERLGDTGTAARQREQSMRLYATHREQQQRLVALLDESLAGIDPKLL